MKWILTAALCAGVPGAPRSEARDVPAYTNDDLARVRVHAGETGGGSGVAAIDEPEFRAGSGPREPTARRAARGEAFWRREAERHLRRIESLELRLRTLDRKLAERRRKPGVRPYSDPSVERYRSDIGALKARIRAEEEGFLDRARREGALPGWLR